jgi:hypothetical protein
MDSATTLDTHTHYISMSQSKRRSRSRASHNTLPEGREEPRSRRPATAAGNGGQAEQELQQGMATRWSRSYSGAGATAEAPTEG